MYHEHTSQPTKEIHFNNFELVRDNNITNQGDLQNRCKISERRD